jgi:hypothetical protein
VPLSVTAEVAVALHTVWLAGVAVSAGVGFTVTVKLCAVPVQPPADGVTVMTPDIADVPPLVAVNDAILPVPEAARPVAVLVFTQVNVSPLTGPENETAAVPVPLHTVWLEPDSVPVMAGVGLTVMLKLWGVPPQPPAEGVTVMVPATGDVPLLVPVNEAMLPLPDAPRPMAVLLFAQA